MKLLEERIQKDGEVKSEGVLKVGLFLNHQMDIELLDQMGAEWARLFAGRPITKILTIEASGIGIACMAARHFGNVPVVFAKKGDHRNVGADVYTAEVFSFTHQTMNVIRVSRRYLQKGMRVLIIDDFLANGEAIRGLMDILRQAGCELVGAGVCVEKGFQPGGQQLREEGVKVVSLAIVDAIQDGRIILRDD